MEKCIQTKGNAVLERRKFLQKTSLAGLSLAGASILGGAALKLDTAEAQEASPAATAATLSASDVAILNFALNLEYLEAEFYTVATTGSTLEQVGIPISGTGREGPTENGEKVYFTTNPENVMTIAQQIAEDEQTHVKLLRSVLGSQAIAKPAINLAALGPVGELTPFLAVARAFEDVGVSAYGGAAPLLQSNAVLATAARILATEAYHASNLRLLCDINHVVTKKVDAQDIVPPLSGTSFFNVLNGLTPVRTTSQVLAVVYGNSAAGTKSGGFFPNGVNGSINTV
jgi:hypothetical protein